MTPEFDRHGALILGSPYWDILEQGEVNEKYMDRNREFHLVQRAIQTSNTYDDLQGEAKAVFDRAEAEVKKYDAEFDKFAQSDADGYGRFHSTEI